MLERTEFVCGMIGGAIGRRLCECERECSIAGEPGVTGSVALIVGMLDGGLDLSGAGSVRAPAHASRRCTYIRRPSFHFISSSKSSCLFHLREMIGWARSSGVLYL